MNTSNMLLHLSSWGKGVLRKLQKPKNKKKNTWETHRWKIVKGDLVEVIEGFSVGQRGKVKAVLRESNRIIVEGVNMRKRFIRPKMPGEYGKTVTIPYSLHYSNVQLVDPVQNKPTKVMHRFLEDGSKVRISCLSGHVIPKPDWTTVRRPRRFFSLGHKDTPKEEVEKITFTDYEKYLPFIYKTLRLPTTPVLPKKQQRGLKK